LTPWVRRGPAEAGAGGPCTHALVVGVSRYEFLTEDGTAPPGGRETFGLQQARSPATSAFLFARWLESTYRSTTAPLGTIRLLLSPSEWETENVPDFAELPVEAIPATRENVEEAVAEWFADCATSPDNVAILYTSGHGIQMSPDDGGIVLLEDFAKLPSVLDFSLDVGAVRKGMAGPTMAQRQFYFVDACRVRPEAALRFQTLGSGIGLPNPFAGTARVSAVYFAATPSTEALGAPGKGTLFVQALLECLDTALGVDDHALTDGTWAVTATTLVRGLPNRVRQLAEIHDAEQSATTGGQLEEVPFHVLPGKPQVPITITLTPPDATACALARLFDPQDGDVFSGEAFAPTIAREVPRATTCSASRSSRRPRPSRTRPSSCPRCRPRSPTRRGRLDRDRLTVKLASPDPYVRQPVNVIDAKIAPARGVPGLRGGDRAPGGDMPSRPSSLPASAPGAVEVGGSRPRSWNSEPQRCLRSRLRRAAPPPPPPMRFEGWPLAGATPPDRERVVRALPRPDSRGLQPADPSYDVTASAERPHRAHRRASGDGILFAQVAREGEVPLDVAPPDLRPTSSQSCWLTLAGTTGAHRRRLAPDNPQIDAVARYRRAGTSRRLRAC
jgi:hypothetical protein